MSIGLPYKGSKSEIAEELVAKLPPCGKILDACCGGGAVLVALAQSLKYKSVVGNDRNPATIALLDAVLINKGQIEYEHPEPCSRNDFFVSLQRIENDDFTIQDCVNKFCASFGNDGKTYLYGAEIEPYKLEAEQMLTAKTLEERRRHYRKFYALVNKDGGDAGERLQKLEFMQRLQSLERLERLERLDIFDIDYSEFDMVYFDIPYKGTNKYDYEFDHERFYSLFKSLKNDLNIPAFLSEYDAPFTCVAEFEKTQLMAASVGSSKATTREKLYFNGSQEEYKALMGRFYASKDAEKVQLSLF